MSTFTVRPILPKHPLDAKVVEAAIESALTGAADGVKVDFGVTTQTWNHQPVFTITASPGRRKIQTDDPPFIYVSGGTRVRYATMTRGFKAKTTPGVIGSVKGSGGVLYISKMRPRPGIQARRFAELIGAKWNRQFPVIMQRALRSAVNRSSP